MAKSYHLKYKGIKETIFVPSKLSNKMPPLVALSGFIAWKKVRFFNRFRPGVEGIAKLWIPGDAIWTVGVKANYGFYSVNKEVKCRASKADVIEILKKDSRGRFSIPVKSAYSIYDDDFIYEVGKTVKPKKKYNKDPTVICASGIHFYMTRAKARNHI